MKKFSIIVLILIGITAFGQKRELTNAWSYWKDGFLDDAKMSIDKAEKNPETKDSYKTYWFKGKIYRDLSISRDKKYQALCKNVDCLDVAYESLMKSITLNFKKEENRNLDLTNSTDLQKFGKIVMDNAYNDKGDFEDIEAIAEIVGVILPAIQTDYYNQGLLALKAQEYDKAYQKLSKATTISFAGPDGQLDFLTSLAAIETKRYNEVVKISGRLIDSDYGANEDEKVRNYLNQAMAYKELNDSVKMLKVLDKGIEKFPMNNYPLIIEAFNYYVLAEQNDKALEYINMAIEKDPNKAQFYSVKGSLLGKIKKLDEARATYEKAISLDPVNFDANFELGILLYNSAVDTIKWADVNIPAKEIQRAAEYEEIANKLIAQSVPYFEKARNINPNNLGVLTNLRIVYYKTRQMDKYQEVDAKIKEMTVQEKSE